MTCSCSLTDMVHADELQQHLVPWLPALDAPGRRYHMMRASSEILQATNVIEAVFYIDAQACVDTYRVCTDEGVIPLKIRHVLCDGVKLHPRTSDYDRECPNTYFYEPDGTLYLNPAPLCDGVGAIEVRASVGLDFDACAVPRTLVSRALRTIVSGALAAAYLLEDTEFQDSRKAGIHESRFRRGISTLKAEKLGEHNVGPLTMKSQRWI